MDINSILQIIGDFTGHKWLPLAMLLISYATAALGDTSKLPISIPDRWKPVLIVGLGQVYAILQAETDGVLGKKRSGTASSRASALWVSSRSHSRQSFRAAYPSGRRRLRSSTRRLCKPRTQQDSIQSSSRYRARASLLRHHCRQSKRRRSRR